MPALQEQAKAGTRPFNSLAGFLCCAALACVLAVGCSPLAVGAETSAPAQAPSPPATPPTPGVATEPGATTTTGTTTEPSAAAQPQDIFQQFQRFAPLPPATTRQPRYTPDVSNLGGLELREDMVLNLGFSSSLLYDDNVFGTPARYQKGDFLQESSPSVALNYLVTEEVSLTATYAFGWHDYLRDVGKDYLTHDANVSLSWRRFGIDGLSLNLSESYRQTGDTGKIDLINLSGGTNILEESFLRFARLQGNNVGPTISYQGNGWSAAATYQYGIIDYFGSQNSSRDESDHSVNGLFTYQLTDKGLTAFCRYYFTRRLPWVDPSSGTNRHTLDCGLQGTARKLTYELSLEPSMNRSFRAGQTSREYQARIQMGYSPDERIAVQLQASQEWNVPTLGSTTRKSDVSLGSTLKLLSSRGSLNPSLTYSVWQTAVTTRELGYHCRFTYHALKYVDSYVSFDRLESSASSDVQATDNRVQVGFFIRF